MISVPHPYTLERARADIEVFGGDWLSGVAAHFAVAVPDRTDEVIGYVAIKHIDPEHAGAELSFWIGGAYSGRGFVTEAAGAALDFAFDTLPLNRICAYHMARNPASAKVLARLGMTREGLLRQRVLKWGKFEDVAVWAILREDRAGGTRPSSV